MSRRRTGVLEVAQLPLFPAPTVAEPPINKLGRAARRSVREVLIPVEPTFDVAQGIREGIEGIRGMVSSGLPRAGRLKVTFDARHLELAVQNARATTDPDEPYLSGHGVIVNLGVFLDIVRSYGALMAWHKNDKLTKHSALEFGLLPPREGTRVRALWDVLGMERFFKHLHSPTDPLPVFEYQSRYVSPILRITDENKAEMVQRCHEWLESIADRLGGDLRRDLITTVPEIMSNLVRYGFAGGAFLISVWPMGQAELIWMNRVDHIEDWPEEDTAAALANACLHHRGGGSGMNYILKTLLPRYNGVLAVNHRGNTVVFQSNGHVDIRGTGRRHDLFVPRSILFSLELFAPAVRERSGSWTR